MPNVTITRDGLFLDDRPFYLLAGQLHYFRFPQAEWRSILLTAKAGGLNTIDTVIPWNLHEPVEGTFDFDGLADLAGYLDLCSELGLYVIARPGPYICAEWENGGLPAWLANQPDMAYRFDNPAFLAATRRWFDTLLPILAARQADRDGPIILVQIENEHWASGVYGHDAHQTTLAQALRAGGIRVPLYTCMGAMPGAAEFRNGWTGIDRKLVETRACWPDNPMIVSELWSGWFDNWGASRHNGKSAAALDNRLHELTAAGASGLSHWMWAGGTNFGFWGGRTVGGDTIHMTTSYDYDAPVSEYGGLTEKYYVARRHHLFLSTLGTTLAPLLARATPGEARVIAPKAVAGRAAGGGAPLRSVRSGSFGAVYLRNDTVERQTYQVFVQPFPDNPQELVHMGVEVEATSIKPLFTNLPLGDDGLHLAYHTGRILGFWPAPTANTLIVYGFPGEMGQLMLILPDAANSGTPLHWEMVDSAAARVTLTGHRLAIEYWLKEEPTLVRVRPSETAAGRQLNVLLLTQADAERCWPVDRAGFIVGPHCVSAVTAHSVGWQAHTHLVDDTPCYWVNAGNTATPERLTVLHTDPPTQAPPDLGDWTSLSVAELIDSDGWLDIDGPGAHVATTLGYTWYRAQLDLAAPLRADLAAPGLSDRAHLFIDGRHAGSLGIDTRGPRLTIPVDLTAGTYDLRMLVDNLGRFNYGSGLGERKGLTDNLYGRGRQTDITRGWTALWQEASFAGEAIANAKPAHVRADAVDVDLAAFPFSGPDIWLLREIDVPAGQQALLYLTGDRNPGALFVNGQAVSRFSRHYGGGFFKLDVTPFLRPAGNVVALHIRDYAGAPWHAWLVTYDREPAFVTRWSFRAGATPGTVPAPEHQPRFWRARFGYDRQIHGSGPFKLSLGQLHKGQLWLNGHNLGRYWQVGPQEYYKLPASWLAADNELLIFEEQPAAHPSGVRLWQDALGASRSAWVFIEVMP